jgi:hypothetical protein
MPFGSSICELPDGIQPAARAALEISGATIETVVIASREAMAKHPSAPMDRSFAKWWLDEILSKIPDKPGSGTRPSVSQTKKKAL